MFEQVTVAPPDPILGLTERFNADPSPDKINLSVGVYKDAEGKTPILHAVKEAEKILLKEETSKGYKPMTGDPAYGRCVREYLFGESHPYLDDPRAVTAHTPGGTGALRVAGDYLAKVHNAPTLHLSDPTWANHKGVFTAAELPLDSYPYFDKTTNTVDFAKMIEAIGQIPAGDVVLLHGCCHNPTGADLSNEQWQQVGQLLKERGILPLVDFAYQGFAEGVEEDAQGLRTLANICDELIVCSSFSKNFGLYNERVGAITIVAANAKQQAAVTSQLKLCIRTNYSNPPAHGAAIVQTVFNDADLRHRWHDELTAMRNRINSTRQLLVDKLAEHNVSGDYSFITAQRGMFSFSGLTPEHVKTLIDEHAVYIVNSGRINVAGITEKNVDRLCQAIKAVVG